MSIVRYSKDHEWVRVDGDEAVVGITDFAQQSLGDIVYVELPDVGRAASQGKEIAVVESVKAASEVFSPVSGTVTAVNDALGTAPDTVNNDPEGAGWFFKLHLADVRELGSLMDLAAYQALVAEQG